MSRAISRLSLFYSLMAGPVLWFVHFLLVWGVAEFGCRINFRNVEFVSPAAIQLFVVVVTVAVVLAVAVGGLMAWRGWRYIEAHSNEMVGEDRLRFLLMLALLLSGLFLFTTLFTAAPSFFLSVCDLPA
jgi:hypothetical protein